MSSMHHRTWQHYHVGHLNVTVQLDSTAENRHTARHQELAGVARQLIATMDAERIPTTWAVTDPAHSAATSLIMKSAVTHELAILGGSNWIGPTAGRTRFARELARRVMQARCAGLEVTTLVPEVASVESQIDLIVKQRITAVVGGTGMDASPTLEPRALHYGVWELPVSAGLPLKSSWFGTGKRALLRRIHRSARDAGEFHIVIDAAAIAASNRDNQVVAWLLSRVSLLRDRGLLCIETLRETAARLSNVPAAAPQRSILRAA